MMTMKPFSGNYDCTTSGKGYFDEDWKDDGEDRKDDVENEKVVPWPLIEIVAVLKGQPMDETLDPIDVIERIRGILAAAGYDLTADVWSA